MKRKLLFAMLPYRIAGKRVLPLIGAALMGASCSKDEPEPQKHDVEIEYFYSTDVVSCALRISNCLNQPDVNNVYLVPQNERNHNENTVPYMVKELRALTSLDPSRIWGRGNFILRQGILPEQDSLWMVSRGWTVNAKSR